MLLLKEDINGVHGAVGTAWLSPASAGLPHLPSLSQVLGPQTSAQGPPAVSQQGGWVGGSTLTGRMACRQPPRGPQ